MAAIRHLNLHNFDTLSLTVLEAKFASALQISLKSDSSRQIYSDKPIFKMAAVRHIGFVVTSTYMHPGTHYYFPDIVLSFYLESFSTI